MEQNHLFFLKPRSQLPCPRMWITRGNVNRSKSFEFSFLWCNNISEKSFVVIGCFCHLCVVFSKDVVINLNWTCRAQVTAGPFPWCPCCCRALCGPSSFPRCVPTGPTTPCSPPCPPTWTSSCTLTYNRWGFDVFVSLFHVKNKNKL